MRRIYLSLLLIFGLLLMCSRAVFAQEATPTPIPNNRFGIHILFPQEVSQAAKLVNSNGGDYGYVTIPLQAGDRDLSKWQQFMDDCAKYHLIPIIRLATEGDYFNTNNWRKPTSLDIVDFANFLDSLNWPTKERYVIMFNEVNRANEWGGSVNPAEYAKLLQFSVSEFKSKTPDFFIISAGLDNAAENTSIAMNEYTYLFQMNQAVPGIFNQIDGIGSHSYANPAFSSPPDANTRESISSFHYEKNLIESMASKDLPVFITETGWTRDGIVDEKIGQYFQQAFNTVWNSPDIMAVTPFLLLSGDGPFAQFSFLKPDGSPTTLYSLYQKIAKVAGHPLLATPVLAAETTNTTHLPVLNFGPKPQPNPVSKFVKSMLKVWVKNDL